MRAAIIALALAAPVAAQTITVPPDPRLQWIHDNRPDCCDHRECKPATVTWTPHGWRVGGADHIIPFGQQIAWPFNEPYACIVAGRVRCLFMQEGM